MTEIRPLILGTAGHIDHGKTLLIKALTGIDADRLPEEQRRGMTIDLGFAHIEVGGRRIGIVDVPGHERFIRNMVAGATGIDLVMLIVAADDGVMPQTREHLEIIDLLGVSGGLIALNKIDLVNDEAIRHAEGTVRALVRGTCLEGAPIVRVSAATGEGVAEVREAIGAQIGKYDWPEWPPLFRLPVDRKFSLKGHGTIVTGSLMGGNVAASDEVELLPRGKKVRVRSAQSHGAERAGLESGRRVAVNLPGVKTRELERGNELAAPGYLRPASRFAVRLRCLKSAPLVVSRDQWLRLHIGTRDVDAKFALIGCKELEPGETCRAILQTKGEICAVHGQRFIIRSSSHGITIGGGIVLRGNPPKVKLSGDVPEWLRILEEGDARERILIALEIEPELGGSLSGLYRETGVTPAASEPILLELAESGRIRRSPGPKGSGFWTESYIERCKEEILARIGKLLERDYPRTSVERGPLLRVTSNLGSDEFVAWLLEQLAAEGKIIPSGNDFKLSGFEVALGEKEVRDQASLLGVYEAAGCSPPAFEEAAKKAGLTKAKAEPLYAHALDAGRLVEVSGDITLHRSCYDELLEKLRRSLGSGEGITVSQFKELIHVSRKYAIPICEHLDRMGFTRRQGDLRYAGSKL